MHYFHKLSLASGTSPLDPRPHQGSISRLRWGTFVPRLLICPPLEKILRAPVFVTALFGNFVIGTLPLDDWILLN